jgi:8-oxo-dGTP pyrophosphatase MutT (NUDIX family)
MTFPSAFKSYIPRTHCITSHVYGVILISPDDQVVVVQGRQSGKWSFPKGHGHPSETPLNAALRELKEETGIDMSGRKPDNERHFKPTGTGVSGGTYFIFEMKDKPVLHPEDTMEVMDVMWYPRSQLDRLFGNKDVRAFCRGGFHLSSNIVATPLNGY